MRLFTVKKVCLNLFRGVLDCRYGFFNNKRIVLYDTLVEQCSEPQVVAVLAHELGKALLTS